MYDKYKFERICGLEQHDILFTGLQKHTNPKTGGEEYCQTNYTIQKIQLNNNAVSGERETLSTTITDWPSVSSSLIRPGTCNTET